jgi:hypothetical protein
MTDVVNFGRSGRRAFLRGAGGLVLAIPFLPSLAPKRAAARAQPPLRFAMMLSQYGRDVLRWSPQLTDAQLTNHDGVYAAPLQDIKGPISYILSEAFDPVRKKISVVQGLDELAPFGLHNSSLPTTGSARDPASANGFGYSIDCVLEESKAFYPSTPVAPAFRTSPGDASTIWRDHSSFSWTSRVKRGESLQGEWNPQAVYRRYFDPTFQAEQAARGERARALTDRVHENYRAAMTSKRIGAADRQRLDNYMALIREVDALLAVTPQSCDAALMPEAPTLVMETVHSAMINLEVAALACGTTKIVMHSIVQGSSNQDEDLHGPAHAGPGRNAQLSDPPSAAATHKRWQMARVAELLTKLDAVTEEDGTTLLDNTLFIYANEDGDGSHKHVDLPVLVAGGQGKLRTGYYIDYRPRPFFEGTWARPLGRPYNQLLVSAFHALGLAPQDYQRFGQRGFGPYDVAPHENAAHYAPFLKDPDAPLPFLCM